MQLCDYGCDKESKYKFKNGKYCCSKTFHSCPEVKKNKIPWNKDKKGVYNKKFIDKLSASKLDFKRIKTNKLCDYGCGKIAQYKLHNEKLCCSKYYSQCPYIRNKNSKSNKGKPGNRKGYEPWNKGKIGVYSKDTIKKIKTGCKLSIDTIKKKRPFFSQIEEMRYNPDKINEKEIQVHCKNHNCKNSKEQDGWFTPTPSQLGERIRCLEISGIDNSYFYCSEECKHECPLYASKGGGFYTNKKILYTNEEYNQFREVVLERDNYECQYCGEKAEHVHHERPQKLEPFFALDPDYAWSCCEKCHYEKGHKDECSTGNLARYICR